MASQTRAQAQTKRPVTPEWMLTRAIENLDGGADPQHLLDVAAKWIEKWTRLVEENEAGTAIGHPLDGRASIYTGETYAEARDRWDAYRGLLVRHLGGPDGGGR